MTRRLADAYAIHSAYGLAPSTLRTWADRGKVNRYGKDSRGRTLYDVTEVETAIGYAVTSLIRPGGCSRCALPAAPGSPVPLCVPHVTAVADYAQRSQIYPAKDT